MVSMEMTVAANSATPCPGILNFVRLIGRPGKAASCGFFGRQANRKPRRGAAGRTQRHDTCTVSRTFGDPGVSTRRGVMNNRPHRVSEMARETWRFCGAKTGHSFQVTGGARPVLSSTSCRRGTAAAASASIRRDIFCRHRPNNRESWRWKS